MEHIYLDLGLVYEQCQTVWYEAMVKGGDFSIADALGSEITASLLSNPMAGHVPVQGAIAGIIDALAKKPSEVQQRALAEDIPFDTTAGLHVRTRDIAAASRWIASALKSKLSGSDDPIGAINDEMVTELTRNGALGDAPSMSNYLAAVTLVGGAANFPGSPPAELKSSVEMAAIADAAEKQGTVTPAMVQIIIEKGATVTMGGVHGHNNIVASGAASSINASNIGSGNSGGALPSKNPSFWRNPKFYGWLTMVVIAALTLYATVF